MNKTIHYRTIYHIHHDQNCFAVKVLSMFITINFSVNIHPGYRHPQQRPNSAMHLQQSSRLPTSVGSMLRTPMSTMHQQDRKYTEQFPRQTGVTRFARYADAVRFHEQVDVPRIPRQMGVTRCLGQADDASRNQHTQQIPPHVQYQPQTLQNVQNRTHTEDRYMFHPSYLPRDY